MISTFFGEQMQSLGRLFTTSAAAVPSAGGAPRLTIERLANKVAVVSLNRPAKLNALDMDMFRAVRDAALELRADGDVRCVVLKGEGRGFCAGLDVKSIMSPLRQRANTAELLAKPDGKAACLAQEVSTLWRSVPCPVIAAVHGVCLGGGLQIALGADVRVAAPKTKFSVMEAKWGLIPDMGITASLRELVNRDVALELTATGRVFEAEEALSLGLVTRVADDPVASALATADAIAAGSPDAAAAAKRLWHAAYDAPVGDSATEDRLLMLETDLQKRIMGGWNQVACTIRGLGAPPLLTPGFYARDARWSEDAEAAADARLAADLDADGGK